MHQDYCTYVTKHTWIFNGNMIYKIDYILLNEAFMFVKRLFHTGIINVTIKPSSSEAVLLNHSKHPKSHFHTLHWQPIILDMWWAVQSAEMERSQVSHDVVCSLTVIDKDYPIIKGRNTTLQLSRRSSLAPLRQSLPMSVMLIWLSDNEAFRVIISY